MSDLINRESLKQKINLNYNNHQYIDAQAMKDIINTEPTFEDKTVEELEKIKAEIEEIKGDELAYNASDYLYGRYQALDMVVDILQDRISELKGE